MVKKKPAIFLDRDGVLNIPKIKNRKSYAPTNIKDFKLYPSVSSLCKKLKKKYKRNYERRFVVNFWLDSNLAVNRNNTGIFNKL